MTLHIKGTLIAAVALAVSAPAIAEPVDTEAVILSQEGDRISARSRQGPLTIVMTGATKIRERDGLQRKTRDATSLIPGLIVQIEGDQQGDTISAAEIEFKERDWRTAVATKAGTVEEFARNTAEIQQLRQAIIDGQEYVIQQEATVYFATGVATVSPEYREKLRELAQQASTVGNYRVSILGFADPSGDAAANERLSLRRAAAVSNFLRQTGLIEPGRVLSPSAMGEGTLAPGEAAPASDAEARRVLVRLITPKTQLTQ